MVKTKNRDAYIGRYEWDMYIAETSFIRRKLKEVKHGMIMKEYESSLHFFPTRPLPKLSYKPSFLTPFLRSKMYGLH